MRIALLTALSFCALSGHLIAGPADWKIVKLEAAEDRPGYLEVTVRNTSEQSLELARHWPFEDAAAANVCFLQQEFAATSRFAANSGSLIVLIAEPCHYPEGWKRFIEVRPGESIKALLPTIDGFEGLRLGLVLTEKNGRVVVGLLAKATPDDRQADTEPATKSPRPETTPTAAQ